MLKPNERTPSVETIITHPCIAPSATTIIPNDPPPPPPKPVWPPPEFPLLGAGTTRSAKRPATPDPEALELIIEARGAERVEAEFRAAIEFLDKGIAEALEAIAQDRNAVIAVQEIGELREFRRPFARDLATIQEVTGSDEPIPAEATTASVEWLLGGYRGVAMKMADLRRELSLVNGQIDDIKVILADDARYVRELTKDQGPLSFLLDRLSDLVRRRRELTDEVAMLERSSALTTAAIVARLTTGVELAGGKKRLIRDVEAALYLIPPAELSGYEGAVAAAESEHLGLEKELDALASRGIDSGGIVDDIQARKAAALDRVMVARSERAEAFKQHAAVLVMAAMAGDEPRLIELERLVQNPTSRFPDPVRKAISAARLGR